ncbi:MAG: S24 family peptidase [Nitrospira sp.]
MLPIFLGRLPVGFPTPADDSAEGNLDLNKHVTKHPVATFFVRSQGDSMIEAGIRSGDLLVVDRSREAADGNVIVAALDGGLVCKRLKIGGPFVAYRLTENIPRPSSRGGQNFF